MKKFLMLAALASGTLLFGSGETAHAQVLRSGARLDSSRRRVNQRMAGTAKRGHGSLEQPSLTRLPWIRSVSPGNDFYLASQDDPRGSDRLEHALFRLPQIRPKVNPCHRLCGRGSSVEQ